MGVLSCNRANCNNIMCDRHSPAHGHICRECFEELVSTGPDTDIAEFMSSEKRTDTESEAIARYEAAFPSGDFNNGD